MLQYTNTAGQPCGYVQLHNATCCVVQQSIAQDFYNGKADKSTSDRFQLQNEDTQPCVMLKSCGLLKGRGRSTSILSL